MSGGFFTSARNFRSWAHSRCMRCRGSRRFWRISRLPPRLCFLALFPLASLPSGLGAGFSQGPFRDRWTKSTFYRVEGLPAVVHLDWESAPSMAEVVPDLSRVFSMVFRWVVVNWLGALAMVFLLDGWNRSNLVSKRETYARSIENCFLCFYIILLF